MAECPICGKSTGRNKICCSSECYSEYRQHYAICPICGTKFKHSPSDITTHTCGKRECAAAYRSMIQRGRSMSVANEAAKVMPLTGHFETNNHAVEWNLIAPDGMEYTFRNLNLWIENHMELLPVSTRTGMAVDPKTFQREITRLKGTEKGTEKKQAAHKDYYGWTIKDN